MRKEPLPLGSHYLTGKGGLGDVQRLGCSVGRIADSRKLVEEVALYGEDLRDPLVNPLF
ncbi:MAG: hypothetical protein WKF82_08065 [Nocardioidaceae bacterium]